MAAGARILTGVQADTITTALQNPHGGVGPQRHARKLRATGVRASISDSAAMPLTAVDRRNRVQIQISSQYVVSSAGSVHTPALLLRSGIRARGNVGANLRLHPATFIAGTFPQVTLPLFECSIDE